MVGIVIVSHSRRIADGVVELAREMGGEEVALVGAGGTDEEDALGTDAMRVLDAINEVYSEDGVLVLMDLGSAVMSAEMAVEMLEEDRRRNLLLCEAPLVEGAVAATTAAKLGGSLEKVAVEARGGLAGKQTHLGVEPDLRPPSISEVAADRAGAYAEARIVVHNPLGLHARPAARFVRTAGEHNALLEVTNLTTDKGPVDATSLNALTTLGVLRGHEILVAARGDDAEGSVAAIVALAADNFGDPIDEPTPDRAEGAGVPTAEGGLGGLKASPGIALGRARHLRHATPEVPTRATDDIDGELVRLDIALAAATKDLTEVRTRVASTAGLYEAEIFDAQVLMLEDQSLLERARELIRDEKRNAAHALWTAIQETAATFEALASARLRERGRDVTDAGERVLTHLLGGPSPSLELSAPGVVITEELTPGAAAELDPEKVRAVATATGGPTSHGAILARALGVPAVVGVGDRLLQVPEGSEVIVDGDRGVVIVEPDPETRAAYERSARDQAEARESATAAAHEPAETKDGAVIEVAANIGSVADALQAVKEGADGVGLLRTEFLFLERTEMPTEEEQFESLAEIADALGDRPLTIRTLDVGADKPLSYLPLPSEDNPFLGLRGIRLGLAQRGLLETQLRAIARLASQHRVRIMFPMVATVQEFFEARQLLNDATDGVLPEGLEVGIMIEVPAAALTARFFAPHVDFFSIGTNDLTQYVLAAERGNAAVAALADPLHPAVLSLVAGTADAASAHDAWVGVCGEVAGEALATPLLLGLGVTELSMAPPSIAAVKMAVRTTKARSSELAKRALACASASEVRALLDENGHS
jgi:multiphosphoryl transfer protein